MRFSIATVLAFAASAFAQAADFDPIYTPKANEVVPAGAPFTVTWEAPAKYLDGTITIELIGGATQNTQTKLSTIASKFVPWQSPRSGQLDQMDREYEYVLT